MEFNLADFIKLIYHVRITMVFTKMLSENRLCSVPVINVTNQYIVSNLVCPNWCSILEMFTVSSVYAMNVPETFFGKTETRFETLTAEIETRPTHLTSFLRQDWNRDIDDQRRDNFLVWDLVRDLQSFLINIHSYGLFLHACILINGFRSHNNNLIKWCRWQWLPMCAICRTPYVTRLIANIVINL